MREDWIEFELEALRAENEKLWTDNVQLISENLRLEDELSEAYARPVHPDENPEVDVSRYTQAYREWRSKRLAK